MESDCGSIACSFLQWALLQSRTRGLNPGWLVYTVSCCGTMHAASTLHAAGKGP